MSSLLTPLGGLTVHNTRLFDLNVCLTVKLYTNVLPAGKLVGDPAALSRRRRRHVHNII